MYDRINLRVLLEGLGLSEVREVSYAESVIPDWSSFGLDQDENGKEYKPGSLYIEAVKP